MLIVYHIEFNCNDNKNNNNDDHNDNNNNSLYLFANGMSIFFLYSDETIYYHTWPRREMTEIFMKNASYS